MSQVSSTLAAELRRVLCQYHLPLRLDRLQEELVLGRFLERSLLSQIASRMTTADAGTKEGAALVVMGAYTSTGMAFRVGRALRLALGEVHSQLPATTILRAQTLRASITIQVKKGRRI